jgi:5-methylcytosine-specific restriction endonuclease McrA
MRGRSALGGGAVDAPAGDGGTPVRQGVARARDPLPAQLRFAILQGDGFRCQYCGRPGTAPGVVLHVDHVAPVVAGGTTSEDNLLTACEECNLGKGPSLTRWRRATSGTTGA